MAFWNIDLTTRMGAQSAAFQGAIGCFIFSGLAVLGVVLFGGMNGLDTVEGMMGVAVIGGEAVLALIAGLRLRAGKGAFLGSAVALLLTFEMVMKLVGGLAAIGGIVINAVVLVVIVQGVRGAWALRAANRFAEDEADAFR